MNGQKPATGCLGEQPHALRREQDIIKEFLLANASDISDNTDYQTARAIGPLPQTGYPNGGSAEETARFRSKPLWAWIE